MDQQHAVVVGGGTGGLCAAIGDHGGGAPSGAPLEVGQSWGYAAEFGIVPLTGGQVYWFAVVAPAGTRYEDERAAVLARFGAWDPPIADLIETSEAVLHHDINHLRTLPGSFVRGRVVLLGDLDARLRTQLPRPRRP